MQYCKISITKNRNADGTQTTFEYPKGYDAKNFNICCYENSGKSKEFAIATTTVDTVLVKGIISLTKLEAEALINQFVDSDKDIDDIQLEKDGKSRKTIIANKKVSLV